MGHNAIAAGFQGQRHWTDHFPNGDFMETILTSSFDWNGIREPFVVAAENDAMNGAAMLFGRLFSRTLAHPRGENIDLDALKDRLCPCRFNAHFYAQGIDHLDHGGETGVSVAN